MKRNLHWLLAICVCVGCGEKPAPSVARAPGCAVDEDRWEPGADSRVVQLADSLDLSPTGGLARLGDGVVVFDEFLGRVTVLDNNGALLRHFGRFGDGPGELNRQLAGLVMRTGGAPSWLETLGRDTIVLFDGRSVQLFSERGDPLGLVAKSTDFVSLSGPSGVSRVRALRGSVLIDVVRMGSVIRGIPRTFSLIQLRQHAAPDTLVSLRLADVPRVPSGGTYAGPREAMPLWDMMGDCYVVFDGWSPHVLVGRLGEKGADTVRFSPPTRPPPPEEDMSKYGAPARRPEPARLLVVRRMIAAPDGWVWFLPNQPEGLVGQEVVRLSLLTGEQRVDTVPHFPARFESGGSYLATPREEEGGVRLFRVLLGGATTKRFAP